MEAKYFRRGFFFIILYQLAVEASANLFLIHASSDEVVRLFFLAPAVSLAFIVRYGARYIPFLVVNPLYNTIANSRPLFFTITLVVILPLVYGGFGYLLKSIWLYDYSEFTLSEISKFVIIGCIAPIVNAFFIQIGFLVSDRTTPDQLLPNTYDWFIGDLIGIFTLFPLIIVLFQLYDQRLWKQIPGGMDSKTVTKQTIILILDTLTVFLVFFFLRTYDLNMAYLLFLPIAIISILTSPHYTILIASFNSFLFTLLISSSGYTVHVTELQGYVASSIFFALFLSAAIEDKKKSEQMLQVEEKKRLEEAKFVMLGKLAQGISHDLNNALTALNGQISLLQIKDEIDQDKLNPLHSTIDLITNLNNQMLTISGFRKLKKERVDINSVITSMNTTLHNLVSDTIELEIQLGENIPQIIANQSQLKQVILNLTVNAVEAIPDAGKITVRTYTEENAIFITITDTGSGISANVREEMFEMLVSSKPQNSGLGLWIVQEIVSEMNGDIFFETDTDHGTTFTIKFPPEIL